MERGPLDVDLFSIEWNSIYLGDRHGIVTITLHKTPRGMEVLGILGRGHVQ